MGYESRFYVVEKSLVSDPDDGRWAEVVAEYNLAKCYEVSDKLRNYPIIDCYIYATDGNTRIKEDCYGEPLREIPLVELPSEILPRIMVLYCEIDNRDIGSLHNERAVLCHHYEERKYHFDGLYP